MATVTFEAIRAWSRGASPARVPGGLWLCEPITNGPSTLMLCVLAPDRVGLLGAILDRVRTADPDANLDGGQFGVVEGCASMTLVFRSRAPGRPRVDDLVSMFRALKDEVPDGVQYVPVRIRTVSIHAPDRPGILSDLCRVITEARANIQALAIQSFAELPPETDLLNGTGPISGVPVADLTMELGYSEETPHDLLDRLAAVAPGITAKFVD